MTAAVKRQLFFRCRQWIDLSSGGTDAAATAVRRTSSQAGRRRPVQFAPSCEIAAAG